MLLRADAFSPYEYRSIQLPQLDLELGDDSTLMVRLGEGESHLPLHDQAFEQLVGYLGAPFGFAKKLRNAGRGHVLSYLHKQLSEVTGDRYFTAVTHPEKGLVGLSEKQNLFFIGSEAIKVDESLEAYLAQPDCPLTLKSASVEDGHVSYLMFLKQEHDVVADTEPVWRWGYEFRHSIWGQEAAAFYVSLERMVCANLTYMPEDTYHYPLAYDANFGERDKTFFDFLKNPPEPNWKKLEDLILRLRRQQASVAEVKKVRSSILGLFKEGGESDPELKQRLEQTLGWKDIVEAYGLKEMDEKPSPQWFKRASTDHNLYDLYNFLTCEATHAPKTIDGQKRQSLLVFAGSILTKKPDLQDLPPRIDWAQRRVEKQAAYQRV